jgi:ubiquinone/menaquinone biosynthesis C-methylase UbiE
MRRYILDNAAAVEYERLDLMSKILDPWTRGYLGTLGVGEGWHCLELGGGNGSIAEWLAATVGRSGSVTSIDINPVLLELSPAQNLSVQQMDLRTAELGSESYDLVTCRALLHQIAEYAPQVVARMAEAVKPGGWLLIQEPDFHLAPTTEPEVWARTWEGVVKWGRANGIDWMIGRKLPSMVAGLGLGHPQAKTDVQNIRGRDRGALYFQLFLAEVRDRVIAAGQLDAATIDAAAALLDDPNYWTQCWMMTAVWVRKPLPDAAFGTSST